MADATLVVKFRVDTSAFQPLANAARGRNRFFWKHLDGFTFWFTCSMLVAWLALTTLDVAIGKPTGQWAAEYLVAAFWFMATAEENRRCRAEAILKALDIKVGAS